MTNSRTEHRNAITKLVNDKKIIMQKEVARRLNKTDIKGTVEILVNEGKFKREKIKVRLSSGGLMEQYVLYSNKVKYEDVLDFEKEMINKPFESPLKEHHCYNKVNPEKQITGKRGRPKKVLEGEIIEAVVSNNNNEWEVIDNSIIPIYSNHGERIVNARELHEFLGVGRDFSTWIKSKIEKYKFVENVDYIKHHDSGELANKGFQGRIEYLLKMDTAKEIAMVENNERGRYIRKYFIEVEKRFQQQNELQPTNSVQILKHMVNAIESLDQRTTSLENKLKLLAQ